MEDSAAYESVICQKNEVHVYKIPPLQNNLGYKANDWKVEKPDWTGKMQIVAKGKMLMIKLVDRISGDLFAMSVVEQYPGGVDVQPVTDSSRYYVIRISETENPTSTRKASIGIGFVDRGDSFDFQVSLTEHFKWLKQEKQFAAESQNFDAGPQLDLGFKEGQTIKLNLTTKKTGGEDKSPKPRPKSNFPSGGGIGILPPPPGGVRIAAPPRANRAPSPSRPHAAPAPPKPVATTVTTTATVNYSSTTSETDLLFGGPVAAPPPAPPSSQTQSQANSNIDLLMGLDLNAPGGQPLQPASNSSTNASNDNDSWANFD